MMPGFVLLLCTQAPWRSMVAITALTSFFPFVFVVIVIVCLKHSSANTTVRTQ